VAAKDEEVRSKRKLFTPRVTRADVEKMRRLRNEMERVRLLTDMSWKRERYKRQLLAINRDHFETELAHLLGLEKRKRPKSTKSGKVDRRRATYRRSIGRYAGTSAATSSWSSSSTSSSFSAPKKRARTTSVAPVNGTRFSPLVTRGKVSESVSERIDTGGSGSASVNDDTQQQAGVRLSRRLGVRVPLEKHRQMQARRGAGVCADELVCVCVWGVGVYPYGALPFSSRSMSALLTSLQPFFSRMITFWCLPTTD
jgi:hypothetical protein